MGIILHHLVKLSMSKMYAPGSPPLGRVYSKESVTQTQKVSGRKSPRTSVFIITQATRNPLKREGVHKL